MIDNIMNIVYIIAGLIIVIVFYFFTIKEFLNFNGGIKIAIIGFLALMAIGDFVRMNSESSIIMMLITIPMTVYLVSFAISVKDED